MDCGYWQFEKKNKLILSSKDTDYRWFIQNSKYLKI